MASFDDFVNAIVGQESGGNYRAVNKDSGALGFAQVMPSNVAAWSREILGYAVTPSQFLNSPDLQRRIVNGKLRQYYDRYGARGAAAAWYSGDPSLANDTRSQNGYPSIKSYVDSVMNRMGGGDYGYSPTNVTDNRVKDTSIEDLLGGQGSTKLDALSGADRGGLGLKQVTGEGTEAATGGMGLDAAQGAEAPKPKSNPGQPVGDTFQQHWQAADAMQSQQASGSRQTVIDLAKQFLGTPYVWGGNRPGGFDCSGLIQYAMQQAGFNMPRVSWDQLKMGSRADIGSLQPGDLVGFHGGSHIALYLGGGKILEAPRSGLDVRIRSLGKGEDAFGVSLNSFYG